MKRQARALLFAAFMAVVGMVFGASRGLSLREAIVTGAIAMAITLAVVLPALWARSDEDERGQS